MALPATDTLNGADGDDTIMGGAGNDTIDGGGGSNTALYVGPRSRYTLASAGALLTVTDNGNRDGTDSVTNVAFLGFSDKVFTLGDGANNTMVGTAGNDAFEALGGHDNLTGAAGDDTLYGGDGNDTIDGGTGRNTVSGGAGNDAFNFRSGANALRDTPADLNGDAITGFGSDDALDIQGALIGRTALNVATSATAATVSVGGSSFEMTGDFSGGDFMTVARGAGADAHTIVTFVPFLPSLSEDVSVDTASINGVANEPFLFGDGSVRFSLELKSAVSAFHNTLGVYTVAADGTIGGVRILFSDTLNVADAARMVDLGTPGEGARLAFFLIQDGFDFYGALPNDLTFVKPGTTDAANIADDRGHPAQRDARRPRRRSGLPFQPWFQFAARHRPGPVGRYTGRPRAADRFRGRIHRHRRQRFPGCRDRHPDTRRRHLDPLTFAPSAPHAQRGLTGHWLVTQPPKHLH